MFNKSIGPLMDFYSQVKQSLMPVNILLLGSFLVTAAYGNVARDV